MEKKNPRNCFYCFGFVIWSHVYIYIVLLPLLIPLPLFFCFSLVVWLHSYISFHFLYIHISTKQQITQEKVEKKKNSPSTYLCLTSLISWKSKRVGIIIIILNKEQWSSSSSMMWSQSVHQYINLEHNLKHAARHRSKFRSNTHTHTHPSPSSTSPQIKNPIHGDFGLWRYPRTSFWICSRRSSSFKHFPSLISTTSIVSLDVWFRGGLGR